MPQITINVPEVPTQEPTTSYDQDVTVSANIGATSVSVPLGSIQNDGNVDRTLQVDVSGQTPTAIGYKDASGNMFFETNTSSVTIPVAAGASNEVVLEFAVTPGNPGDPATQVTANLTSQWV